MKTFKNLSIRTKLGVLSAFLLLLMFGNSMLNRQTIEQIKVTGPIYTEVVSGKDLVADILPPPAYIIEAYLTSIDLAESKDTTESDRLVGKLKQHKDTFKQRMDHWSVALPSGALKDSLFGAAKSTAEEYFKLTEDQLLPIVRAGNLEDARDLVRGPLKSKYQQHHDAITDVVRLADEHNRNLEASTVKTLNASSWWTNVTAVTVSFLIAIVVWMTSRNATRRIASTREVAKALTAGDFSHRFNADGGDEIDQMGSELSGASQTLEGAISSIVNSMEAAANQDYSQLVHRELPGELNRCRGALNSMLNKLEQMHSDNEKRQKADELAAISMTNSVREILDVANRVSHGDYSVEISVTGEDPVGQLGIGLRKFFAEKQIAETAERDRTERERHEAEVLRQKVDQILHVVNSVAEGNFNVAVPDLGDDAVGQVAKALDSAVTSIREALLEVSSVAETVSSAASQLKVASSEIANGAQHQASSLEETASSLEEITSTVKQNTDNAQQARQLANGSRDVAEKGGEVVADAVKAMGEINQASTKISEIIITIDEIAFQTNLLALNAAVEAARAGEQGRGFAVVAAEVRNLAQRSASAAKEIKSLIQDSVRKVENGTSLVNQSGKTLEEIVNSVKRVTDIVAEIAAASREQLTGVEQVNKAVSQMDRVTQSNATQTEEMSGTAAALLQHSTQLRDAVGRFDLGEEQSVVQKPAKRGRAKTNARQKEALSSGRAVETNLDRVADQIDELVGSGFLEF